jgi:hypothetical protein
MTPRRGGGKARRIPTTPPPAAAAPKSRPRKGGAAPGRQPTSSPARPPAARTKAKRLGKPLNAGAKCRRDPTAPAAMRSPGAALPSSGTKNGPETLPIPEPNCPPTPRGYAEREGKRKTGSSGVVWWVARRRARGYGDTDGAGVDETRGNGGRRRYGGVEERTEEGEWGRRRFNGGANN